MKSSIFNFIENLGLVWKYAINGLVGAFIWSLYKKARFWEAFRQIIIGGVVSGYFTPVIVSRFDMDMSLTGFTSFVIGMLGLVIIDSAYKYVISNYKKWTLVLRILFSSSKDNNS
jgi:hypothetical protein